MNLPAKVTCVAGTVIMSIGILMIAIHAGSQNNSEPTPLVSSTEVFIVEGRTNFSVSWSGTGLNIWSLWSNETNRCGAYLDSLNITRLETGSRDFLTWTCKGRLIIHDGQLLERYGQTTYEDWGTYNVTSDFPTWVSVTTWPTGIDMGDDETGGGLTIVGFLVFLAGVIFLGVSYGCCCVSKYQGGAPPLGPSSPPTYTAGALASPPSYQGSPTVQAQEVVVIAQVVGYGEGNQSAPIA